LTALSTGFGLDVEVRVSNLIWSYIWC